jgi:hypothetical protein
MGAQGREENKSASGTHKHPFSDINIISHIAQNVNGLDNINQKQSPPTIQLADDFIKGLF